MYIIYNENDKQLFYQIIITEWFIKNNLDWKINSLPYYNVVIVNYKLQKQ